MGPQTEALTRRRVKVALQARGVGAVRALDLSQNHLSCSWRQEGLRALEGSGKESGERRLSPGGWCGRMGSSLISHFSAHHPPSPALSTSQRACPTRCTGPSKTPPLRMADTALRARPCSTSLQESSTGLQTRKLVSRW